MPLIDERSVEEVREAADLVELVRGRVQLTRRGGRWWGRCPFHDERTPSFCIIPPENRTYYCHGCHASGDAIDWMREQEGAADFAEAVAALADRFGVTLRFAEESPGERAAREGAERRRELLERATGFYAEYLWRSEEAAPAREYLRGRGFADELLRAYRVGYAPAAGSVLSGRAVREAFSREQLVDAGLARIRGGTATDFFTGRIMFPIADARGRVQGFGGRTLDPNERAKYVNSPEGPNFRKRTLLFGLDRARAAMARNGWVVVVEGYTDVFGTVAAGVEAVVACMGTSLTSQQLRLLARSAREVRLCFDADRAGEQAAWRTVQAARGLPLRLSAIALPSGQDPGDLAGSPDGLAQLGAAIDACQALITSLIGSRARRAGTSARERDDALRDIAELLRGFPDSVEKDEAVRLAAGLLRLSRSMEEHLRDAARGAEPAAADARRIEPARPGPRRERHLLALALALPDVAPQRLRDLPDEALEEASHRRALQLLRAGEPPERWPEELAGLAAELRDRAADGGTEAELRESIYRVQLPMLERRAAELRQSGDERGLLEVLELMSRLRVALRGDR